MCLKDIFPETDFTIESIIENGIHTSDNIIAKESFWHCIRVVGVDKDADGVCTVTLADQNHDVKLSPGATIRLGNYVGGVV